MKIERLGEQLIVRIPNDVAETEDFREGDHVNIYVVARAAKPLDAPARAAAIDRIRALAIPLPSDWKAYLRQLRGD